MPRPNKEGAANMPRANKDGGGGLKRKMAPKMPLTVRCEWEECQAEFTEMAPFTAHVTQHLEDTLLATKPREPDTDPEDFQCLWRDCLQEMGRNFIDLVRHVYFHAFHTKLKSYGRTIMEWNELEECGLEDTSRNMIPELPDRLQCGWKDCDTITDNPDYFYHHVSEHINAYAEGNHPEGGAACFWEGCESKVRNRYKLREHLRSHTQEKVLACPTCGGLFSSGTKLYDHLQRQIQSTVQTYQCSHCNKRCPTERLLRDHMRHHVNHYKCPFCDMTCPTPSGLRAHIKYRHSDEKPYPCPTDQCNFRCKSLADLRRHSIIHQADTSVFQCHIETCDFKAKTYFSLTKHFRKEHQQLPDSKYACHLCTRIFSRGFKLTQHLKKDHKFKWPSGHKRFRYKLSEDGMFRLQTVRYESIELTQQLLGDKNPNQPGNAGDPENQDGHQEEGDNDEEEEIDENDSNNNHDRPMRTSTRELQPLPADGGQTRANNSNLSNESDLCYNLEMLGEVASKLPKGRFVKEMERKSRKRKREDFSDNRSEALSDDNLSDRCEETSTYATSTPRYYSESECGRSEYAPSEFGGAPSEFGEATSEFGGAPSEVAPSDIAPSDYGGQSESCYNIGSERYTESEADPTESEPSSAHPTPYNIITIEPSPQYGFELEYAGMGMGYENRGDGDLPPMFGPAAQSVNFSSGAPMPPSTDTSASGENTGTVAKTMHQLQTLPTNIEETTQMLLAGQR